jgi:DNA-binding NarL/FixJ family response regulator
MSDRLMPQSTRACTLVVMASHPVLLIVDDNEAVRSALGAYMAKVVGWTTILVAENGMRALELATQHDPDAIVLDNYMPGRTGIDVLPELRRACPRAKIVMHTTDDSGELREQAVARGADAVVHKGRPLGELAQLIDAA